MLYERLLPGERTALHRAIAAALGEDAPAAQRAHQYHRAGLREEALPRRSRRGMEAARVHAFAEALVHYERALELSDARRSTCSPAPPRRRASPATRSGPWRCAARRSR